LIGFLHALGSGDSMIRVRDMNNLGLDSSQQRLSAKLTLVASFQKKVVVPPPAAKPAASEVETKPSPLSKASATNALKAASATNRPAMTNSPVKKK
jgi:hypothetical protein